MVVSVVDEACDIPVETGPTGASGPPARTLADIVGLAARSTPDRPALAGSDGDLTYAEVDELVDRLADGFTAAGVPRGGRVVVSMHKTECSYLIFHALLRIGAVVVPVDPLMPPAAFAGLIRPLSCSAFVADQASRQRVDPLGGDLGPFPAGVFTTDGGDDRMVSIPDLLVADRDDTAARRPEVTPDDPAYVIFTSGSTGTPKGITHTHRSGLAYARLAVETHGITSEDRVAGMPPLHFDMSTLELYAAPLAGATCVPIGGAELRFPATFTERSESQRLSVWYAVPFQLRQISERGALDQRDLSALRHVVYAGEPFAASALAAMMRQLPGVRFSNAYGPAETNVCTVHELDGPPIDDVPIGRPWGDVEVRIVDRDAIIASASDLDDVPDGDLGELWVMADTVMAGYLDQPERTAERCVPGEQGVWYRTGDLARRRDGLLWLAGRVDHQVKVRGVRLELEAIESVLVAHPDVAEAVVAPVDGAASVEQLVAAVVLSSTVSELDRSALRRWCLERLAQVAVPAEIAAWVEFPLTSSGKIDRASVRLALSHPDTSPRPDVSTTLPTAEPSTNGS